MPLCQRALLVFATGFVAATTPVKAAIICDGSFQIVRGGTRLDALLPRRGLSGFCS